MPPAIVFRYRSLALLSVVVLMVVLLAVQSAPFAPVHASPAASTFVVNSNADAVDWNPGDGICETGNGNHICTLRAAVAEANAAPGSTITFGLGGSIIYLLTLGQLTLNANMIIVGNGADNTIIDGDGGVTNNRVFTIPSACSCTVSISGVTVRNGRSDFGGGIRNESHLLLDHVIVTNNVANLTSSRSGGGIWNSGALTVTQSLISGNQAFIPFLGGGGGIYNAQGTAWLDHTNLIGNSTDNTGGAIQVAGGTVTLVYSTVDSNTASNGGGIFNGSFGTDGALNVTGSGIFSNTATANAFAGGGGGINNNRGTVTLVNSTLYLNVANQDGGGIYSGATTRLYNVTVVGNYADWDGDTVGAGGGFSGTVTVRNSLLAGNYKYSKACLTCSTLDDCKGTFNSEDYNLIQTTTGCAFIGSVANNLTGVVPQLNYPPQFNGGPTLNLALLPVSPAIDAGNTGGCRDILGALIATDQRGFRRPYPLGGRCDIGAYELGSWLYLPLIVR